MDIDPARIVTIDHIRGAADGARAAGEALTALADALQEHAEPQKLEACRQWAVELFARAAIRADVAFKTSAELLATSPRAS